MLPAPLCSFRSPLGVAALAAAVFISCAGEARAQGDPPLLRAAPPGQATALPGEQPGVVRRRAVQVDVPLLSALSPGARFTLDLFDDVSLAATIEAIGAPGVWSGRIDRGGGRFTLVIRDGAVAALIRVPGLGTYQVRPAGDGLHAALQIDVDALPACGNGPAQALAPAGDAAEAGPGEPCADGSVIDLMIVYTPPARDSAGGTAAIEAEAMLAVAVSNEAYVNSQINTQLNLVYLAEIDYDESASFQQHLNHLTNSNDSIMDEAHGLRYQHQADMVALLVADPSLGGIAWLLAQNSPAFKDRMFSVTNWASAAANLVLAHELGHNMGCCHAPGDGGGCGVGGLFLYSVGYRYFGDSGTQWRTVMAYAPGERIANFSNPDIVVDGQPTGVPVNQPNPADNSFTINQTAQTIASYWCEAPYCNVTKVLASDGVLGDSLGYSLARSGQVVVAGALADGDAAVQAGSAYVFRYDPGLAQWVQEAELAAADPRPDQLFGGAVAVDGGVAVIGASADDDNGAGAGAAYVFRYDEGSGMWQQEAKLLPDDGSAGDFFGSSVAISGDLAVVGAWLDGDNGPQSGSAYVFGYDTGLQQWTQQAKLLPAGGGAQHQFGASVVAAGPELVCIGAPATGAAGEPGAAYVFRRQAAGPGWIQDAKVQAAGGEPGIGFGDAVDLEGDLLVVGALNDDGIVGESGSAYVFRFDGATWQQEATLLASDGDTGDRFGTSLAVGGDIVVVGANGDNDNGPGSGAAYVFRSDGQAWTEAAKLLAPGGASLDFFGYAVQTDGDQALVGAFGDDAGGAMFVYGSFAGADCNGNGVEDGCDIDAGTSPDLNGDRVPDECGITGDINGDGSVDVLDLLLLLNEWGPCGDCRDCPADIDGDCEVGVVELLTVLGNWG